MCPHPLVPRKTASVLPVDDAASRRRFLDTGGGNEAEQGDLDRNQQNRLQALSVTTATVAGVCAYIWNVGLCVCVSVLAGEWMHRSSAVWINTQILSLALSVSIITVLIPLILLFKFYHVVSDILKAETNNCSSSSLMSALWHCFALRFAAGALLGVYFAEVSVQLVCQGHLNTRSEFRGLVVACLFVSAVYVSGSIASTTGGLQQQSQQSQQQLSLSQSEPFLLV